jgi:P-type conjugative transfer protein TrbG
MRSIIITFTFSSCLGFLFAQGTSSTPATTPQPGVAVKRVPQVDTPPKSLPPLLQQYDYGAQIQALQQTDGLSVPSDVLPEMLPGKATGVNGTGPIPKDYHSKTDVPLTPTALEAVRVSEKWRGEKNAPAAGPDGRVMYSFGAGLPTVVCAPLRVCIIELQAGEKIVGEPQIGDSVRWNISPSMYGTGDNSTSVIVLKPQSPGLDTNLLVTTDRRAYYIRLISKPEEYVARVAFAYPDDESNHKWQQQIAEQRALAKQEKRSAEVLPAMVTVEKMFFDYKVRGGDEHIRPVRVFDDGAKTFIQMPVEIQHREAPVLVVIGNDGKGEMTNYRVKEQTYIVDRLFDHANLVLGSGKKTQKVEITRGQPKG